MRPKASLEAGILLEPPLIAKPSTPVVPYSSDIGEAGEAINSFKTSDSFL